MPRLPWLRLPFLRRGPTHGDAPTSAADALRGVTLMRRLGDNPNEMIVRCMGVERAYELGREKVLALKGVDLELRRGDLVGLMGRSGSGKTTLLNLIGGLDRPTAGSVWIDGQSVGELSDHQATELRRHKVGDVAVRFAALP